MNVGTIVLKFKANMLDIEKGLKEVKEEASTGIEITPTIDTKKLQTKLEKAKKELAKIESKQEKTSIKLRPYDKKLNELIETREGPWGDERVFQKNKEALDDEYAILLNEENELLEQRKTKLQEIEELTKEIEKGEGLAPKAGLKELNKELEKAKKELENIESKQGKTALKLKPYDKKLNELIEVRDSAVGDERVFQKNKEKLDEQYIGLLEEENDLIVKRKEKLQEIEDITKKINEFEGGDVEEETKEETGETKDVEKKSSLLTDIGLKLKDQVKSVAKMGLALFGVSTLFGTIRNSVGVLSGENKQLANDIANIKSAVANVFLPIIQKIVNLIKTLMSLMNTIWRKFFNKDLFKSNADNAKKMANATQRTLASFDEMNTLQKSGGGGGFNSDEFNKGLDEIDASSIIKKIKDATIEAKNFWENEWYDAFQNANDYLFGGQLPLFTTGIGLFFKGIYDILAGAGTIIAGLFEIIVGVIQGDSDKVELGFNKMGEGIKQTFQGVLENVGGVILAITGLFVDLGNTLGTIIREKITTKFETLKAIFQGTWKSLKDGASSAWSGIKSTFSKVGTFFKETFSKAWEGVKQVFSTKGKIFDGIKDGIVDAFKTIVNKLIDGINSAIATPFNKINTMLNEIRKTNVLGVKPFEKLWGNNPVGVPKIPKLRKGGILNVPGRGVFTGNAIAGEAGRELYMPLQDEQMLSMVGQAIGRYVNVNLTNVTTLDGKTLARETKRLSQENDFLRNN